MNLLETALGYAALDWPVFPLVPGGKVPLIHNPHPKGSTARSTCRGRFDGCGHDGHGVTDASTDPEVIEAWWTRAPTANIGLSCGTTRAGHGPDVVDFDVKNGGHGRESFERLRTAGLLSGAFAMVSTPSGGWHLYYDGSAQGNSVLRGHGVDFRSAGGYVVGVDSPIGGRRYTWTWGPTIPGAGIRWSAIKEFLAPSPPPKPITALHYENDVSIDGLTAFVGRQGATSENRNAGLFWAACKALEDGHPETALDALATAAQANGLSHGEALKAVNSARRHFRGRA